MTARFAGRVVVVTGGARGMGAAHCRAFAAEGAAVVVADRRAAEADATAREIGEAACAEAIDVAVEADWDRLVEAVIARFGRIDVLVNNAGVAATSPFIDTSLELYRRVVDVNQTGVFLGMRSVARPMAASGGGSIVNVSSIAGVMGIPMSAAYNASKFAVCGLTRSVAIELAPWGIRVNAVLPGYTETSMMRREDFDGYFAGAVPIGRPAAAEEITAVVLFLASDDARYCTGSEFIVDGGVTAGHGYPALMAVANAAMDAGGQNNLFGSR